VGSANDIKAGAQMIERFAGRQEKDDFSIRNET
jgi:hypothetical protein